MKPLRAIAAGALTLALAGTALAQEDDLDETLEGGPIVSEKYHGGKGDGAYEADRADDSATQHRRRPRPGRNDPWYDDRRDRDRYGRDGYGSHDAQYSTLYCRARGDFGGRRFCAAPRGADRIYFDKRRSDAPCRRGRDYGIDRGGVWVDNGCRANFTVVFYARGGYDGYDRYGRRDDRRYDRDYDRWDDRDRYGRGYYEPEYVSCESKKNRYRTCRLPSGYRNVELVRHRSDAPCRKGRDWGIARGGIWVDNGCRATFAVTFDRGRRYSSR